MLLIAIKIIINSLIKKEEIYEQNSSKRLHLGWVQVSLN